MPVKKQTEQPQFVELTANDPIGGEYAKDGVTLFNCDVLELYRQWDSPTVIISDGPYGLGRYKGDPHTHEELDRAYEPHIAAWSAKATPQTTLWFWNSEVGWATVHPVLLKYGWKYVNCHIWDKGIAHIAGNANTKTLRKFPVVTEVCVQYVKEARVNGLALREWLRAEWGRTGLPFSQTNEACGVIDAATRKYFDRGWLWYFPPPEHFERLSVWANKRGKPEGRPYFSLDGQTAGDAEQWAKMRSKFYCKHGISNVWREPPLNGEERYKNGNKAVHLNQKPLSFMEMCIEASSDKGDLVWEPFGGLCSGAIASYRLNRRCLAAEIQPQFYELAVGRLQSSRRYESNLDVQERQQRTITAAQGTAPLVD